MRPQSDKIQAPQPGLRQRAASRSMPLSTFGLMFFAAGSVAPSALAQSLRSQAGQLRDTPQSAENRRFMDSRKQLGAIGVRERTRRAYIPEGIRFGNYIILPTGDVRTVYSDNVFRTSNNRVGDFSVQLNPRLRFQSQFSRHALNIDVGGRYVKHQREQSLDTAGGYVSAEGALHINHAHTISFGLLSDFGHERELVRTRQATANELTPVFRNQFEIGITRNAGKLSGTLGAAYNSFDFFDVRTEDGTVIDQDLRDTKIYSSDLKLNYQFSPGYALQSRATVLRTETDFLGGLSGDSWGGEIAVGVSGELGPLFQWQILGGYGFRDFDEGSLGIDEAAIFEVSARWFATQRLTVNAFAQRGFNFTDNAEGSVITEGRLSLDIEARDNLIFTLGSSYGFSESLAGGEGETVVGWSAALEYFHTKHIHFNVSYSGEYRTGEFEQGDLLENKIWFGAKVLY